MNDMNEDDIANKIDHAEIERRVTEAEAMRNIGKVHLGTPVTNGNGIKSTITLTSDVDKLIDSLHRRIKMLEAFKATL